MNICHVITRLIVGGAQENTLLSCAGLARRGHRVTLLTGPDAGPEGSLLGRTDGFDVVTVPSLHRAVRPWADLRARGEIRRWLLQHRPDLVHTHSSKAGILGRLAARDAGVPIIVHTIHGMSFNRTQPAPTRTLYRTLERHCGRFTHAIVTVADAMRDQALAAGIAEASRYTTIYSGMRTELFDPARYDRAAQRRRWGVEPGHIVVGTVARLFRNKGYEALIPAIARAARQDARLRFLWVGDGAQREQFLAQARTLGLGDRLVLTGLLPPDEVPQALAAMDLLVHASQWEGLPRAVVQALLMEVPAISFAIDGAPEVVRPGQTGELVPLHDTAGLAEKIVGLAADPDCRARYGRQGRELCRVRFDHEHMVEQLDHLYKKLADRHAS